MISIHSNINMKQCSTIGHKVNDVIDTDAQLNHVRDMDMQEASFFYFLSLSTKTFYLPFFHSWEIKINKINHLQVQTLRSITQLQLFLTAIFTAFKLYNG